MNKTIINNESEEYWKLRSERAVKVATNALEGCKADGLYRCAICNKPKKDHADFEIHNKTNIHMFHVHDDGLQHLEELSRIKEEKEALHKIDTE